MTDRTPTPDIDPDALAALAAGRLAGGARERAVEALIAAPAGRSLYRFAVGLQPAAEEFAAELAARRRARHRWWPVALPLAAAALLALAWLPGWLRTVAPAAPGAAEEAASVAILAADFEGGSAGEDRPVIFASQFDG